MSGIGRQDEAHMATPELIEAHGYKAETHKIWTEDGYGLAVHRVLPSNDRVPSVPNIDSTINTSTDCSVECHNSSASVEAPESRGSASSRLPVLLCHGLLSSSSDWVLLGPHEALSYVLCDSGYDVWLANCRGNTYSKYHKHYTRRDREFWNFSWHEIGYYDLPAMIDYILKETGHSDLYYIGHSQGTTVFFVMGSERPEYNAKIKGMISLAPAVFLSNQRSPLITFLVHIIDLLEGLCNCWFSLIAGFGSNQLDKSIVPVIFGHFPAGSSTRQIFHFASIIHSGLFRKFDYGAKTNLALYGSTQPPKYSLERVKAPVALFYSDNDLLIHHSDVQKLASTLPNVIEVKKVAYEKFNHIDYLWGRDARTLLYNGVVALLKKF
ncbi:hypothetical protein DMN91_009739 [Ooceraea biroi]|uniref:Lipase n=1 Tax=Ooceraea biroi TaxID=2015173 RepID=A0A3L8DB05_OOCBI|nr:hypothetical protein DMN91_009739 [Ooceraea biroi]